MRLNPKYIQLFGEALIPLLGFFLWEWSLYFILLFYFIDLFVNEVLVNVKSKNIVKHNSSNNLGWVKWGLISGVLFIVSLLLIHVAMYFISPGINFIDEAISFWNYEELGVKQGYLLVPLQIFVSYQQYKMEFLMPARYKTMQIEGLWKSHIKARYILIGFTGLTIGITQFFLLPEMVYVLGIVFVSIAYKFVFEK